jgi:UDP-N-acetylglucosamine 4,6-dehydratase|tara:strand:- start:6478 stop:7437 length:960 start_codon:yes stop_codon:yes gene_type:complete
MTFGTVMITGGTGSFGRAFIGHLLKHHLAEQIVSVSRNAEMRYKLEQDFPDPLLLVVPGDVRHLPDLNHCYGGPIDTIVHAAAEKHIVTGEAHKHYVNDINVVGAKNIVSLARARNTSTLVALSTDKACDPINEYGKSKAKAEKIVADAGYTSVRYGNVAGSSGSVIPLFIKQQKTGEITVTDKNMTRFHMPLSEDADVMVYEEPDATPVMSAVELVIYAIRNGIGGEIFVPRIPSSTVGALAMGFPDCTVREIGIRPGEKMHEDLISKREADRCWLNDDGVYVIQRTPENVTPHAARVVPGFRYTSADSPQLLQIVHS